MSLLQMGEQFRAQNKVRNIYNSNSTYQPGHTRAISDMETPEWGKGENNGMVGGYTDIVTRINSKAQNTYNSGNQYGVNVIPD